MDSIRKFVGFLMAAIMLGAFALPASAATKSISFSVTPAALQSTTTQVLATITNTGNSNGNSFEVDWTTSSNFVVTSVTASGQTLYPPWSTGLRGAAYSRAIFTQQLPNKSSVAVTLNVQVTGVDECVPPSLDWWAYAWTGAPGPASQSFALAPGPYTTTLPSSAICTIAFVNEPTDAFVGSTITGASFDSTGGTVGSVSVKLLKDGVAPPSTTVSVGLSTASAACAIAAADATTVSGTASFTTLKSTAGATTSGCVLTASAPGYGSTDSTPAFKVVKPDGTLGCVFSGQGQNNTGGTLDPTADFAYGLPGGETQDWGLIRAPNISGGCTAIPYTFTLNPNNTVSFVADKLGQSVIVEYVVIWAPVSVETYTGYPSTYAGSNNNKDAGWTQKRPLLAWGLTPASDSDYVPALSCVVDNPSAGLGALPQIPNVDPFHGNGHTQYQPGQQAKMCVAQHGWTSIGGGQVQYWSKIIDTDGFGKLP